MPRREVERAELGWYDQSLRSPDEPRHEQQQVAHRGICGRSIVLANP
jgi:hypothetical protein